MEALSWFFLLGLELHRFAPNDDGADGLGNTLEAVEAGGHTLSAYEGPALQPVLWATRGPVAFGLAPGLAGRIQALSASDGREGTLFVRQVLVEGRVRYGEQVFGELDLYGAGGSATLDGTRVADGNGYWGLAPSFGVRTSVAERLWVGGRLRYAWRFSDDIQSDGLGGVFAVEWRL